MTAIAAHAANRIFVPFIIWQTPFVVEGEEAAGRIPAARTIIYARIGRMKGEVQHIFREVAGNYWTQIVGQRHDALPANPR
jgi:hypothetical protein